MIWMDSSSSCFAKEGKTTNDEEAANLTRVHDASDCSGDFCQELHELPSRRAGPFPTRMETACNRAPKRNYQILPPLDFLAEFTQHIPAKGAHLIRYYGWYSN